MDPGENAEPVERLLAWFGREGEDLPWRHTRERYAVLVAEAMLQATPVARVVSYYRRFMARWPTAEALGAAPLGEVLAEWHGLGYPRRARNLRAAAAEVAVHGWPAPERLTDLPGVGPYTASALRCFADGEAVLPLDTNVRRVLARRFPAPGGWPGTPAGRGWEVGQALMDLGRCHCTARAPRCEGGCPVRAGCPAAAEGSALARTPPRRRQGRYEGSLRQRRGRLLGALAERGEALVAADPAAAASLVADGLARREGRRLVRMGAGGEPTARRVGTGAVVVESPVRRAEDREVSMAKAKRQRRTSIRTMQADHALKALDDLDRVAPMPAPAAEAEAPRAEAEPTGTPKGERTED